MDKSFDTEARTGHININPSSASITSSSQAKLFNLFLLLLELMNLHRYVIITQSLQFTLGFTLGVVHFMVLHYYSIIQSTFTALKSSCLFIYKTGIMKDGPGKAFRTVSSKLLTERGRNSCWSLLPIQNKTKRKEASGSLQ